MFLALGVADVDDIQYFFTPPYMGSFRKFIFFLNLFYLKLIQINI